jgi:type I restriction enzyme, S subunit
MTSMPLHSPYKPSSAPWVDKLPEHWIEKPLFAIARERRDSNAGMREKNLLSLSYGRVVRKDINTSLGLLPESFETYQIVEPGDVIFRLTDLQNDKRSLRSAICIERGIITSAYLALVPEGILPVFFSYLMRAYDLQKVFYSMGGGIRQLLKYDDLRRMPVLVPSRNEQEMIVNFLDGETGRIDHLIGKKGQFIDLLREKRHALVTKLVTTGLDAECSMKDSGSKWLRSVPSHWIVAPVKHFFDSLDGRRIPLSSEERGRMQGKYPYYGASGIIDHVDRPIFREDLVLVSEDGANLTYRNYPIAFVARGEYWVNNHAHILRPNDGLVDFWAERLEAIDLIPYITGSTQPKLTINNLMNIRVSAPPSIDERQKIALQIRNVTARLDGLIAKTERSIELLKEHRSALIIAAVTGKIDVRGLGGKNVKAAA